MKYIYKAAESGVIGNGQAKAVGKELERIEKKHGAVKPKIVVDEARPEAAKLHPFFTWDDGVAAEKYRIHEAQHLIRSVVIVPVKNTKGSPPVKAFVNVHSSPTETKFQGTAYISTPKALSDDDYKAQVLQGAFNELTSWKNRYEHLKEFADVVKAIKAAGEIIQPE